MVLSAKVGALIVSNPAVHVSDLNPLADSLAEFGCEVERKVETPGPVMSADWWLPAAVQLATNHEAWALLATSIVSGFFTKAGEHLYTGLKKALTSAKEANSRFRTSTDIELNRPGKAAPFLTVKISVPAPRRGTTVKFIIPADLPEESWLPAVKSLLGGSGASAIASAQQELHIGESHELVNASGEPQRPPDFVYLSEEIGWVNAYEALDEEIRKSLE
jgi:hypothetical protein